MTFDPFPSLPSSWVAALCAHCKIECPLAGRCKGCLAVYYCNHKCQKKHWPTHKEICQGREKTSLEFFVEAQRTGRYICRRPSPKNTNTTFCDRPYRVVEVDRVWSLITLRDPTFSPLPPPYAWEKAEEGITGHASTATTAAQPTVVAARLPDTGGTRSPVRKSESTRNCGNGCPRR
jgi:hypothetical protein